MKLVPYPAPPFTLKDSTGAQHSLADYHGKWVVLYFYPKDDTPGCTTEACSLRDARDTLAEMGAEIIGISKDDPSRLLVQCPEGFVCALCSGDSFT